VPLLFCIILSNCFRSSSSFFGRITVYHMVRASSPWKHSQDGRATFKLLRTKSRYRPRTHIRADDHRFDSNAGLNFRQSACKKRMYPYYILAITAGLNINTVKRQKFGVPKE